MYNVWVYLHVYNIIQCVCNMYVRPKWALTLILEGAPPSSIMSPESPDESPRASVSPDPPSVAIVCDVDGFSTSPTDENDSDMDAWIYQVTGLKK